MRGLAALEKMLTFNGEDIEALNSLGLTSVQARVYLVLNTMGKATIKTIAKMANIARQDTYRITSELHELSIVEKIISNPAEYRAIPIRDGIDILIQRKHRESSEAYSRAMQFLQRHKHEMVNAKPQESMPQFALVPENEALIIKLKRGAETAQRSIDTTLTWKKFSQGIEILSEVYQKALRKGVEIRVAVEKPEYIKSWDKTTQALMRNPLFKLRTIPIPPSGIVAIYDQKEMLLATSAVGNIAGSPALWSDNPSLISVSQEYFELIWVNSHECKHKTRSRIVNESQTIIQ